MEGARGGGMCPRTLCAAIQQDHLKFAYYRHEMCLQVKIEQKKTIYFYFFLIIVRSWWHASEKSWCLVKQIPKCPGKTKYMQIVCSLSAHPRVPKNEAKHFIDDVISAHSTEQKKCGC